MTGIDRTSRLKPPESAEQVAGAVLPCFRMDADSAPLCLQPPGTNKRAELAIPRAKQAPTTKSQTVSAGQGYATGVDVQAGNFSL